MKELSPLRWRVVAKNRCRANAPITVPTLNYSATRLSERINPNGGYLGKH